MNVRRSGLGTRSCGTQKGGKQKTWGAHSTKTASGGPQRAMGYRPAGGDALVGFYPGRGLRCSRRNSCWPAWSPHCTTNGRQFGRLTIAMTLAMLLLLPLFVYDSLKLSYRVVGPVKQMRRVLRELAEGKPFSPIKFRKGDYWPEMAEELNQAVKMLQETAADRGTVAASCRTTGSITGKRWKRRPVRCRGFRSCDEGYRQNRGMRRGVAAVEFAIAAPVLFLFVFAIFEFGRAFMVLDLLSNAARAG